MKKFTGENLWVTVSSLAGMQFPDAGFHKRKLSVKAFLKPFHATDLF